MKKIRKIEIGQYATILFFNKTLYCLRNNKVMIFDSENFYLSKEIKLSIDLDFIKSIDDNLFLVRNGESGEIKKLDIVGEKIFSLKLDKKYSFNPASEVVGDRVILSYSENIFTKPEYILYNYFDERIIWKNINEINIQIIGNQIFSRKEDNFCRFNIDDGNILWRLNLNEVYKNLKLNQFSKLHKDILILGIGEDKLIGLDINKGSIVWQIDECNNTNYVLDGRDGKLKGVTSIGYFEVVIETGVYKRTLFEPMEKLFNDPTIFDSQRDNFVLVDNHIITTDCKRGIIGAFNTQTLQYDWFHEEKGVSFPGAYPIKYFKPYLFLMDSKDTLHIFKNEEVNV